MTLSLGQFVKWNGVTDRIIGTILEISMFGGWTIRKLDGGICTVSTCRLTPASLNEVDWAIHLGGCTIPKTGNPPDRICGR